MDNSLAIQYMLLDEDEVELSFNDDERTRVLAAAIIAGSEVLYDSQNDRAFITMMGVNVSTFSSLLTTGFAQAWYETPIPCDDVSTHGNPRTNQRSLDAAGVLGLVLHYLSSTMHAISLQQIFAIIPSTVTQYLNFGLRLLLCTLRTLSDAKIQWPGCLDFERCSALVVARHSRLGGAFGSIDGLKLPVQTSNDVDIKNATFNGWLSEHFISSVLAFSAEGVIIAARLNAPGSWHDSCLAHQIYASLQNNTPPGYYIVADTAFPRSLAEIDEHMVFNHELLSYRQTAEWGMCGLQGAFRRLHVPLEIGNKDSRGDLIEICVRLHNLHAIQVCINQIRTVYLKHCDFENMLFSEQRQKDRVARFHVTLEYE
ncbi:hypothetical protein BDR05DRAFT_976528 [Suillus weaverae]|nr:hypothetical protein BDR05DRAFT_976528 [Suillus weaverae]